MEIIAYLFVIGVVGYVIYAYTLNRKAKTNPLADDDFSDCQTKASQKFAQGSSEYNAEVVGCYIHKKTERVKKLIDETD